MCALHAKRVTIMPKDLALARRIRGETQRPIGLMIPSRYIGRADPIGANRARQARIEVAEAAMDAAAASAAAAVPPPPPSSSSSSSSSEEEEEEEEEMVNVAPPPPGPRGVAGATRSRAA